MKGATECTTSFTAARNAGLVTVIPVPWMSTISVCGSVWPNPAWRSITSARCAWPTFASFWSICFVLTALPTTSEAMTKASQPKTAVFQWLALQRPIRAAMLFDCFRGDIVSAFE